MLQVSSAAWIRRRAAPFAVFSTACVREKMNSEVGIRDADFTYIKKLFLSEVGTRNADFGTVKVGIPYADFLFFLYGYSWKSADGFPTSAQWKSVIQVPTSIHAQ